ncbi:Ribonuclease Y [bioreactor metagenome]|uniref:Ribonuclease Y n=1 Tax=bioreactor metagenome TaxID=1076179 RepID=A0A644T2Z7_9ZZZZ
MLWGSNGGTFKSRVKYSALPLIYFRKKEVEIIEIILIVIFVIILGFGIGYFVRKKSAEAQIKSAEDAAKKIVEEAERAGESKKKEALVEAKEEIHKIRNEVDRETKERRSELQRLERRLLQKEENLDRKIDSLEKKEEVLSRKDSELEKSQEKVNELYSKQLCELERLSGFTSEEARNMLLASAQEEIKHETAIMIKELEQQAKEEADKKAREIISLAIQRCAADHVAETTVSVVALPNDEMKGRIIGREGRNIRTLETLTGIDLIIDDTPEAVILSGFDPVRREVARIALEKLIADGRIHPARIEEMVEKAQKEVEQRIKEAGEQATFETGVYGLHPEVIRLLGRLKYRTSYGQNVLKHSIEVSHLAGVMAAELGVDVMLAKRAGLLHDIGKAVDHEVEGPHVTIGADLAKKYRESSEVVNAIGAHHGDEEPTTVQAVLVAAADAVSAARPGARRESLESYLKRLTRLEEIAESFDGVDKSFAIQAGREIRIMVKPDKIDDLSSIRLVRDIVKKIESELEYPGQIKVTVIRETRAVDYAK